jgi:hypothetical protein
MLLAEFDYTCRPHPTISFIDTKRERFDSQPGKSSGMGAASGRQR